MTPSPEMRGDSSLPSHSICIPRHTPSSGVPRATASVIALSSRRARSAASPAPKAPTPGNTTRRAAATTPASSVTTTLEPSRLNALVIDARLATPEFTMTTSGIESPLGGRHVVEARAGDCLLECEAGRLPAQSQLHLRVGPSREIHHGACQRLVQRGVCPTEPVDAPPLPQGPIDRLTQRERAVFGGVVVVDLEVSFARERQVESGVVAQRIEQMVEEAEACLHVGLPRTLEGERDRDRCLARGAGDGCGARGHGSRPSAWSVRSRASLSRSKSGAFPGRVMRSAVSSPRRSGKSRTSATWAESGPAPRSSWARASATEGAATV